MSTGLAPHQRIRIVIAGGPGTGKSVLLSALQSSGERCYPEVSRDLIREQIAQGGKLLPWVDLEGFARRCIDRMQAHIADSAQYSRSFFDRGIPDVIGYLRQGGMSIPSELWKASSVYTPVAFLAPPWQTIYANDPERPQTFSECVALSSSIREAYLECGFRIVELYKASIEERVRQIRTVIDELSSEESAWAC